MRFSFAACAFGMACAHGSMDTGRLERPSRMLVLDGAVLSCHVANTAVADTGCAALTFLTVKEVSVLSAAEAVRYFGPRAQQGAYVARTPALDLTALPTTGRVVPVTIIVNGNRFVCLVSQRGDPRGIGRGPSGPVFPCPVWEALAPDKIAGVELVKPPRSIALFGRDAAAYALIVTPRR